MKVIKFLVPTLTILLATVAEAQFMESFSDGELSASPEWSGDLDKFTIVSGRLRLQAPAVAGSGYLVTSSRAIHGAEWTFSVQMDFTPSSTNYAKTYLVADQPLLTGPLNGYFVKIGNTTREVSLYKQSGSTETKLIDGLDDRVNQTVVNLRVKVTRDEKGMWELFSDAGLTGVLVSEGVSTDNTHTHSAWFGMLCQYTSTRADKFWFDDFGVTGAEVPDSFPPAIVVAEAPDSKHIQIQFSEPVDPSSVDPQNILIDGIGHPEACSLKNAGRLLECLIPMPLLNGVTYVLKVSGIRDSTGNVMPLTERSLRYLQPGQPRPKSVLITEVFADPLPQIGLPEVEFMELFNREAEPLVLKDWSLTDGSSTAVFPDYVLLPGQYLIVTSTTGVGAFGSSAIVALSNFPSLNNSGDHLLLRAGNGLPVDSVAYAISWYRDEDKASGGWSLELIDLNNPCGESDNWTASEDESGGTPGRSNSVLASKPDLTAPVVLLILAVDSLHVLITFNELLEPLSIADATFECIPSLVIKNTSLDPSRKRIAIEMGEQLQKRVPYEWRLDGIRDCNGNRMEPAILRFGLPEKADSLDVILSEVLFNPFSGGVDFVEVYNASEKFIHLRDWTLSNGETTVALPNIQLRPHQWLALTSEPPTVQGQYPTRVPGNILQSSLPSFPDDEGLILLRNNALQIMDELSYRNDWHSSFLKSTEGVSLERVDPSAPTQHRDNWASAASAIGFATPGLPNSNQRTGIGATAEVNVVPEIFLPGSQAAGFAQIFYRFKQTGFVSNVTIYNHGGLPIKEIARQVTLGSEGFLRWDGDCQDGSRAVAGYYFVWFEYFDPSGQVNVIRKRIVLAPR